MTAMMNHKELMDNELSTVNGGCKHDKKENLQKKRTIKFTPVDPKERDLPWRANRYK